MDRNVLLEETVAELISAFSIKGKYAGYTHLDVGHINDTFVLNTDEGDIRVRYIVQRVNTVIFKNIDGLINNISSVTAYLKKEIQKDNLSERYDTLNILPASGGKYYYKAADGGSYRIYDFVENSVCYQSSPDVQVFKQSAIAFARFQKYLDGFPAAQLVDSIPNFHNTRVRFDALTEAVRGGIPDRAARAQREIDFACERESIVDLVVDALNSGELPVRVTHNDTKLNNVMFDVVTNKAVCVIDLDTIMKGSLLYDFGDSIRFGCNTAAEDEPDLSKVTFDLDKFTAYAEGYLSVLSGAITKREIELLVFSAILMTYECGIRFLSDYLTGDSYFKTAYPEHNLIRAKNQFKLVLEMEKKLKAAEGAVVELTAKYN